MYLIDSDVLIDAKNRHYGFDFVPAFWDWIVQQHRAGRVFTVQKVADEVLAGEDELARWMSEVPASFCISVGLNDQASLRAVAQWATSAQFTQGAVSDFLQKADYHLVAQAATLGYTVVTQETSRPHVEEKGEDSRRMPRRRRFIYHTVQHAANRKCQIRSLVRQPTRRNGLLSTPTRRWHTSGEPRSNRQAWQASQRSTACGFPAHQTHEDGILAHQRATWARKRLGVLRSLLRLGCCVCAVLYRTR